MVTRHKSLLQELPSSHLSIPRGTIHPKVRYSMPQKQLFPKVLQRLVKAADRETTLTKRGKPIKRLILPVHKVDHIEDILLNIL